MDYYERMGIKNQFCISQFT